MKFVCPRCTEKVEADDSQIGLNFSCPTCQHRLVVPQPPKKQKGPRIAPPDQEQPSETDHIPYCFACKTLVAPQVVAVNETSGGLTVFAPNGLARTQLNSTTSIRKFCPNCGAQVYSKLELDAFAREEKRKQEARMSSADRLILVGAIAFIGVILVVLLR